MKEHNQRRGFIKKVLLGLTSLAALPLLGTARYKNIKKQEQEMNKIKKIRPLGFQWETLDPFLFCVHHEDYFPKGNENMGPDASYLSGRHIGQDFIVKDGFRMYHGNTVPGFPGHPHRGFETITVVRKGLVDHADSTGAAGRYGNGDVQWMTAGKGVQHSEMFPLVNKDEENPMELFQIWLNLPKKSKMVEPHFKMLWAEDVVKYTEGKAQVEVLVGKLGDKKAGDAPPDSWAADANNHVAIYNIHLEEGATWILPPTEAGVNRVVYYYEGNGLNIDGTEVPHYHAAEVEETETLNFSNPKGVSKLLVLQGRPIAEPVVQHGPFVMNTRQEIQQAFEDYHRTQFGGWPWSRYDYVHDRKAGRFARHADGTQETKQG